MGIVRQSRKLLELLVACSPKASVARFRRLIAVRSSATNECHNRDASLNIEDVLLLASTSTSAAEVEDHNLVGDLARKPAQTEEAFSREPVGVSHHRNQRGAAGQLEDLPDRPPPEVNVEIIQAFRVAEDHVLLGVVQDVVEERPP